MYEGLAERSNAAPSRGAGKSHRRFESGILHLLIAAIILAVMVPTTFAVQVSYRIEVDNATDLVGFEFDAEYSEQLNFTSFVDGTVFASSGELIVVQPTNNETTNRLETGVLIIMAGPGINGSGNIIILNFDSPINATPNSTNITRILFSNSQAQAINVSYSESIFNDGVQWIQEPTPEAPEPPPESPPEPPTPPSAFSQQFQPSPEGSRYASSDLGAIMVDGLGTFIASITYVADLIIIGFVALAVVGIISVMRPLLKSE